MMVSMDDDTDTAPPNSLPPRRPARLEIHVSPGPTPAQQITAAIAADPCGTLGHRPAWLARGGVACGRCGVRL
jgi:hypothetical protein